MSSTITTFIFLALGLLTSILTVIMYLHRSRFIRTLKGQKNSFVNISIHNPDGFMTMLQIYFPVKLENVEGEKLEQLRDTAVKSTRRAMISLLITIPMPVIIFNILQWIGV
jgi:hypothetical protein